MFWINRSQDTFIVKIFLTISDKDRDAQDSEYGHVQTEENAHCPDPHKGASIIGLKDGMVNRIWQINLLWASADYVGKSMGIAEVYFLRGDCLKTKMVVCKNFHGASILIS